MDLISIIVGIFTGVLTGIFAGLVTFRYGQYEACKSRLLELVWSLETGTEWKDKANGTRQQYYDFDSAKEIYHIAGHLSALGHKNAANIVRALCQDIAHLEVQSYRNDIGLENFRIAHQKWMDMASSIHFCLWALFFPRTSKKGHYPPYNWLM